MRERPESMEQKWVEARITPARAGKTHQGYDETDDDRDHPRSCGKDTAIARYNMRLPGSPPLVRERPPCPLKKRKSYRITPARAGKTLVQLVDKGQDRDHPRSCGKDVTASQINFAM